MTNSIDRPVREVTFILAAVPAKRASYVDVAQFVFPLAVFEDTGTVALLMPERAAESLFSNFNEMRALMEAGGCADIAVLYHPDPQDDPAIYSWRVFIAWKPNDVPALAEMVAIDQYARRMWERYRHLAVEIAG